MAAGALPRLVDDYLASCHARGLSPNTLKNSYGYPLKGILLPYCESEGITSVGQLDNRALDRFSRRLLEGGGARRQSLSKHSVHAYVRAVNHFLSWARQEGEAVNGRAQLPKLPSRLLEVLSREEIDRMEDAAKTERDKLIVRLLADTGIRVNELVMLRVTDMIERDRTYFLRIRGKGSKERLVPIPRLYRRLRRYAERGRAADAISDRIFLSLKRRPRADYEPLTPSGVQQMIRNLAQQAGIRKRVYPHLLRHSYATYALSRGMNPIQLAEILGHSSLQMIQRVYAHLTPQDAYEAMARVLMAE